MTMVTAPDGFVYDDSQFTYKGPGGGGDPNAPWPPSPDRPPDLPPLPQYPTSTNRLPYPYQVPGNQVPDGGVSEMAGGAPAPAASPAPAPTTGQASQIANAGDLMRILTILQSIQKSQTKPEDIAAKSFMDPADSSFLPRGYIQQGNTTFGGIPYARSKYAVGLSSLAATLNNLAEVQDVQKRRQAAAARDVMLNQAIQSIMDHVNRTYGTPDQTPTPTAPPAEPSTGTSQVGSQ